MAGGDPGPTEDPPDLNRSRLPQFMRNKTYDGVTRFLQLRMKTVDGVDKRPPLPQNPFLIGKSVEQLVGSSNLKNVEAIKEGQGAQYILRTSSPEIAEKLLSMTTLLDKTLIEVVPHPTLNSVQGVVYQIDSLEFSEEAILDEIKSEGVTAVRRIKKRDDKKNLKNTPLLVLTFCSTVLPEYVRFELLRVQVRPYYPSPMICRGCGSYGHTHKRCDSTTCSVCFRDHPTIEGQTCSNEKFCKHCNQEGHSPTSRDCPSFQKEEAVIRLKVNKRITFQEARAEINQTWNKPTYASQVQQRLTQTQRDPDEKDKIISLLRNELAKLRQELKEIRQKDQQGPIQPSQPPQQSKSRLSRKDSLDKPNSQQSEQAQSKKATQSESTRTTSVECRSFHNHNTRSVSRKRNLNLSQNDISPSNPKNGSKRVNLNKNSQQPQQDENVDANMFSDDDDQQ
ncbi:uncharacterized protein LOC129743220 [Uranotaenia lowii]|uniref:uncharacterized protein LOC129743220 n=1 Tax=Uranotaenia lowii TaxID=190385 RepID=UPI00247B153B|nr:uncharacterized protein LOC129743220 [Uranotaenia lowii]